MAAPPATVVLNLSFSVDVDVQTADAIDDLAQELARNGSTLVLTRVRERGAARRSSARA